MSRSGVELKSKSKPDTGRVLRWVLLCVLLCTQAGGISGCASHHTQVRLQTAPDETGWLETQLYFGLGPSENPEKGISEALWRQFLDTEVTPRFPSGFTVVDAYGQWKGTDSSSVERLRSKLLILVHPETSNLNDRIEAVRTAWKKLTGDESVLRVSYVAHVSF